MREHFVEGDVVVCEIQAIHHDGSLALHTRSLRYGKLVRGVTLQVSPQQIGASPSAFREAKGLLLVVGANGRIWLGPAPDAPDPSPATRRAQAALLALASREAQAGHMLSAIDLGNALESIVANLINE